MPPSIVTRRAAEIRDLLGRGSFAGLRVPLRNGGTLPAEMFAKIVLDDLRYLSARRPNGEGCVSGISWRQLTMDVELLHEVVFARTSAATEQDRAPA